MNLTLEELSKNTLSERKALKKNQGFFLFYTSYNFDFTKVGITNSRKWTYKNNGKSIV